MRHANTPILSIKAMKRIQCQIEQLRDLSRKKTFYSCQHKIDWDGIGAKLLASADTVQVEEMWLGGYRGTLPWKSELTVDALFERTGETPGSPPQRQDAML